jgi:hypothetical protein
MIHSPGVLSGFVIHYNYCRLFRTGYAEALAKFSAARFARLYPLFLFFLIFSFAADDTYLADHFDQAIGFYLTLTQSWFYRQINGHLLLLYTFGLSWSISTEMFFYLIYVLIVPVFATLRSPRQALIGTIVFVLVATAIFLLLADHVGNILHTADRIFPDYVSIESNFRDSFYRWLFYFSPYIRVFEFIAGCFAAQLFLQLSDRKITRAEWRLGQIVFWLSLCGLIAYGYFQRMGWPAAVARYGHFASENFGCAPEIAALIFCVSRYDTVFSRWLGGWLLVTLGETSYSIYIVHTWTLKLFARGPMPANTLTMFGGALRFVLGILFTLIVSSATYRLIEVPSRRWLRHWSGILIERIFHNQKMMLPDWLTRIRAGWATGVLGVLCLAAFCAAVQFSSPLLARYRPGMRVSEATYGWSCVDSKYLNTVKKGNATSSVRETCNFTNQCEYLVDVARLNDVAPDCGKDFTVTYKCTTEAAPVTAALPGEANGNSVLLKCD